MSGDPLKQIFSINLTSYTPAIGVKDALAQAEAAFTMSNDTKDGRSKQNRPLAKLVAELFDAHMNGPRTLSNQHLSHLTIATSTESSQSTSRMYDLFLTAPHLIGDGSTLHATANELFLLLSDSVALDSDSALITALTLSASQLAPAIEDRLPHPRTAFQKAAMQVDYQLNTATSVGGHVIPRTSTRGKRNTVMEEVSIDKISTARLLKRCKEEGVTVSNVMFVVTALAWARTVGTLDATLPL